MLITIAFVFVFFIEMLIATIFFNSISEKKKPLPIILLTGTLIFEIGTLINVFVVSTSWLNVTFSVLATVALSMLFFKIKTKRAIFYSVLLVSLSTILEHIVIFVISSFSKLYLIDYQSETTLLVVEVIISKIIYFISVLILQKFSQKDKTIAKVPAAFYLFPIITLVSVLFFWYISLNQQLELQNQIVLGIVSVLLLFATLFIFFAFQTHAQKESKMLLLQQDKIKTDISYYEILEQQNTNLRIYAHDAKNHISAIKNLNTDPQIDVYISKMLESLEEYSNVSHSGNKILDVIIDKYITECNINKINFVFDVKNNNLVALEYHDTVTILGNLLDNALEAASVSKDKTLSFETDYRNNYSVIIISNSCDTQPKFDGNKHPLTTKEDKALHGFGLRSVKRTVKKYNGDIALDYDADKSMFVATVMLE